MDETIVVRDQRPTSCLILQEDCAHFLASSAFLAAASLLPLYLLLILSVLSL